MKKIISSKNLTMNLIFSPFKKLVMKKTLVTPEEKILTALFALVAIFSFISTSILHL